MGLNEEQIAFWNGTAGDRWVLAQERMDRAIRPLGAAAARAASLAPGSRVLDVGCGCGDTTVALVECVGPGGTVTGVDVSEAMLGRARERLGSHAHLVLGDAATAPLPEVDRLYSRFGVMFFDDPVVAFTHLRSALAPGGRMAFVCWQALARNPWARVPLEAAHAVLGPPPPAVPHAPGPFAFAEPDRVRTILGEAGFADVEVVEHLDDLVWSTETDDDALRDLFVQIGPAARLLVEATPGQRDAVVAGILERVRPFVGPRGLVMPAAVWIVTAARDPERGVQAGG